MPSSNESKFQSFMDKHRDGAFTSWITILIAACVFGGVMSTAYAVGNWGTTAFKDSDAALEEAQGGAQRAAIFPDAGSFEQVTAPDYEGLNSVWKDSAGDYVFDVSHEGYHGDVELMVGIASDGTVAGIQVVSQNETQGIGSNALTDDYFGTFTGRAAADGAISIDGSEGTQVDAVSGATFTSTAVINDVSVALQAYAELGGN